MAMLSTAALNTLQVIWAAVMQFVMVAKIVAFTVFSCGQRGGPQDVRLQVPLAGAVIKELVTIAMVLILLIADVAWLW